MIAPLWPSPQPSGTRNGLSADGCAGHNSLARFTCLEFEEASWKLIATRLPGWGLCDDRSHCVGAAWQQSRLSYGVIVLRT